jgi:hypothetical protein
MPGFLALRIMTSQEMPPCHAGKPAAASRRLAPDLGWPAHAALRASRIGSGSGSTIFEEHQNCTALKRIENNDENMEMDLRLSCQRGGLVFSTSSDLQMTQAMDYNFRDWSVLIWVYSCPRTPHLGD